MKKIVLMLAVFFAGTTISSGQVTSDPVKEVQEVLSERVKFPQNLKRASFNEGVKVEVTVQPDGKLQVVQAESGNTELLEYVKSTINSIALPENMVSDALTISVNILFKVL